MTDRSRPLPSSTQDPDTRDAATERGFIARTFYARGGKSMSEMFVAAKSSGVAPSWFSDPSSRLVWSAAEELFRKGDIKSINLFQLARTATRIASRSRDPEERAVSVDKDFFDRAESLVRPTDDYSTYVTLLRDSAIARRTREAMAETHSALASGEDARAVVSRQIVALQSILKGSDPSSKVSIAALADEIVADYEAAHHHIVELGETDYAPGIQLPWRRLAWALGGMQAGVYVLAARPGVGKTALALNFSRFWCHLGKHVVFNSIDMDPKSYLKRQLTEMTRISQRKMQFAKSYDFQADIAKIKAEVAVLKEMERNDTFALYAEHDIDQLKANCAILKDQGKLDVLIIDYLQLMHSKSSRHLMGADKITEVSNTIHEISVDLGIPILCLSQLNRDNTKDGGREPELSDLRGSGAIEQDATAVLLLARDERLRKKWRESEPPVQYARNMTASPALNSITPVWLKIAKAREGEEGIKMPFVAMQSKYAWYLADYEATGDAIFARVYDDWRHDPIEEVWAANGALIRTADKLAIEEANARRNAQLA